MEKILMSVDLSATDSFARRHLGPSHDEVREMLKPFEKDSLEDFILEVIPKTIQTQRPIEMAFALTESELLDKLESMMAKNKAFRSFIGMGYSDTHTPPVIQRNILENPGWYTQYTPYQAEISQGRLEALINFQTVITELTGFEIANASLLDEGTAAAEAMLMFFNTKRQPKEAVFFVSDQCHPQTITILQTRAEPLGIQIRSGDFHELDFSEKIFGALLQYPATDGAIYDYRGFCAKAQANGTLVAVAADLLSLALLTPPGEFGADAAVGNTQRFGVPPGFGGPHAAYFATKEQFKRLLPGRIIGASIDARGKQAFRMALQTREQHIRREKATSNICTAQVLLAVMAGMYAVYHGPQGLQAIAERIHNLAKILGKGLEKLGHKILHKDFFDTLHIRPAENTTARILKAAAESKMNLRAYADGTLGIALDETTKTKDVVDLLKIFAGEKNIPFPITDLAAETDSGYEGAMKRTTAFLQQPVFSKYHSETAMLRYIRSLEEKDLSLNMSMIPLGSCTMKLNATTEMLALSWPEVSKIHPFAPVEQAGGYRELFRELEAWLAEITGFDAISLQPNAGAQGEYTGLLVIRAYHKSRGEAHRNVCLIPSSAHGTNPASAVMAGMQVVVVKCDAYGNIDKDDLKAKAEQYGEKLAAFMVTYPSTHGVFEHNIKDLCRIVHENGGQVYMDGANLNAQLGYCRPGELGADVCHLNLHKTFSIPHGGGGPGMGPIGVARHLSPFLPSHPITPVGGEQAIGAVSAAPWGSASILTISWAYIAMMGSRGLTKATGIAILNANYLAERLKAFYPILYKGKNGFVAHEFILDFRPFKTTCNIDVTDVARRLMDYGFHAPTVSFPVPGTMMIEPTESENKEELDRFCEALISIRQEIEEIENGQAEKGNNVINNAPHTADMVCADEWLFPYSREKAAYPAPWTRRRKFWPAVAKIDNAYGDRNLVCTCAPVEAYA
jgi:glycine dehydrogenase